MHEHGSHDGDATRTVVIEWAPFRLAPGVSEAELLEASEALQRDFLQHQPGFMGRGRAAPRARAAVGREPAARRVVAGHGARRLEFGV